MVYFIENPMNKWMIWGVSHYFWVDTNVLVPWILWEPLHSLPEVSHLYIVASSKLSHRTLAVTVATLSRAEIRKGT